MTAHVSMSRLTTFGRAYFEKRGFSPFAASCVAEAGVRAQAFGSVTHGLTQWAFVRSGIGTIIDPDAEPKILAERGATVLLDGPTVPGQVMMRRALDMAIPKALEFGIAMAAIRKTHWVGAIGPYLEPAAKQGLLAQAWAQNSACRDCAPTGGFDAVFSTNPIAMAMPADPVPIVADFSTAAVAMGKVNSMIKAGRRADSPIFMDRDGNTTDDPNVVPDGGSILFTGGKECGHKGYALSLFCEALTAAAGGDCNNPDLPQSQSVSMMLIDPESLGGRERYLAEMNRIKARIKGVRRLPGVDEIRLPGERALASLREAEAAGIILDQSQLQLLADMAGEAGLPEVDTANL